MIVFKIGSMILLTLSVWLIGMFIYRSMNMFVFRYRGYYEQMVSKTTTELATMFIKVKKKQMGLLFLLGMLTIGVFIYSLSGNLIIALIAMIGSASLPRLILKYTKARRTGKFEDQLVEGLILLSNSLKAGLDLTQGLQLIVRDMPPPICDEFRLVLQETSIGANLEDSLESLAKRIDSEMVRFIVTAMIIQRESGGDITKIIDRVVSSIRQNYVLKRKIQVLTAQGILESGVAFILPWGLAAALSLLQPGYLRPLFHHPLGVIILFVFTGWQIVGALIIFKMAKVKV